MDNYRKVSDKTKKNRKNYKKNSIKYLPEYIKKKTKERRVLKHEEGYILKKRKQYNFSMSNFKVIYSVIFSFLNLILLCLKITFGKNNKTDLILFNTYIGINLLLNFLNYIDMGSVIYFQRKSKFNFFFLIFDTFFYLAITVEFYKENLKERSDFFEKNILWFEISIRVIMGLFALQYLIMRILSKKVKITRQDRSFIHFYSNPIFGYWYVNRTLLWLKILKILDFSWIFITPLITVPASLLALFALVSISITIFGKFPNDSWYSWKVRYHSFFTVVSTCLICLIINFFGFIYLDFYYRNGEEKLKRNWGLFCWFFLVGYYIIARLHLDEDYVNELFVHMYGPT